MPRIVDSILDVPDGSWRTMLSPPKELDRKTFAAFIEALNYVLKFSHEQVEDSAPAILADSFESINLDPTSLHADLSVAICSNLYVDRAEREMLKRKLKLQKFIVLLRSFVGEGKSSIMLRLHDELRDDPSGQPVLLDFGKLIESIKELFADWGIQFKERELENIENIGEYLDHFALALRHCVLNVLIAELKPTGPVWKAAQILRSDHDFHSEMNWQQSWG